MARHLDDIVLIGPIGAGKSTIGKLLAEARGQPQVSLDELRWAYYQEIGYDRDREHRLRADGGFEAVYRYWKPYEIHAVERVLSDHRNCVIDFGAGHSVYEDAPLLTRARRALAPYRNVVLLLPAPDLDESIRVLRHRRGIPVSPTLDFCEHFVRHPSNAALATRTVYTQGRTPRQTCDEILTATSAAPPMEIP